MLEKRIADWLEKVSVALFVIFAFGDIWQGAFIKSLVALILCMFVGGICLWVTVRIEENTKLKRIIKERGI